MPAAELPVRQIQRYGWIPSLPDFRDQIADTAELKISAEVDPRNDMCAIFDQGNLGSCTGNAVAGAVDYDARLNGHEFKSNPSRLFIYYGERKIEGTIKTDSGAYGRDGFKVAYTLGVPDESLWAYDIAKFKNKPVAAAFREATHHKIGNYRAVPRSINQFKAVLSNRQTIAFGFSVYDSFESGQVAKDGIVPMPQRGESQLGGHEVLAIGYLKSEPNYALCRNSWGSGWGIGGHFLMPWSYLLDPNLSSDFQTIYRPAGK